MMLRWLQLIITNHSKMEPPNSARERPKAKQTTFSYGRDARTVRTLRHEPKAWFQIYLVLDFFWLKLIRARESEVSDGHEEA